MFNKIFAYLKSRQSKKRLLVSFHEIRASENKTSKRFVLKEADILPILNEDTPNTEFDRHYVYHPAWAIRKVKEINPKRHVDISSTLYFSAMLSAFYKVNFFDYRPAKIDLSQLESGHQDLTNLSFESGSIFSLSCMHTVEHIGLGRYGDKIDYDADLKAMNELARVLASKGSLLFVVPIGGKAKIIFNAHRIYTKEMIVKQFTGQGLRLKEFTLIPENEKDGGLVINPSEELLDKQNYACGCFWFMKDQ